MRETRDEAAGDRVGGERHDDRDFVARQHGSADRRLATDDEHVDRQAHEFARKSGETIEAAVGAAVFHLEVPPFDIAEIAQPKQKLPAQVRGHQVRWRLWFEITQPDDLRLLRMRGDRPSRRAAEQRYERAPFHSITSSARCSRIQGTSRPSALAVLSVTLSSNLVGP